MQNRFIDIHTHKIGDDDTIYVYSQAIGKDDIPAIGVRFCAGVHPWAAGHVDMAWALDYLASAPVVAIGEIGLDYAVDIDHEIQMTVLRSQLEVAVRRGLPVVIHCVRAYNDVLYLLKDYDLHAVIFHGYIGSLEQTTEILKYDNYYLSFDQRSLRSSKTVESLRFAPLDRIFAETDDSLEDISVVYRSMADLKNV
jgi:TatD DNase family protein